MRLHCVTRTRTHAHTRTHTRTHAHTHARARAHTHTHTHHGGVRVAASFRIPASVKQADPRTVVAIVVVILHVVAIKKSARLLMQQQQVSMKKGEKWLLILLLCHAPGRRRCCHRHSDGPCGQLRKPAAVDVVSTARVGRGCPRTKEMSLGHLLDLRGALASVKKCWQRRYTPKKICTFLDAISARPARRQTQNTSFDQPLFCALGGRRVERLVLGVLRARFFAGYELSSS
jgi:hypothetical protein